MSVEPASEEMTAVDSWIAECFCPEATQRAFSFVYDGHSSEDFIKSWETVYSRETLDEERTTHTLTFTDPDTRLEVRVEAISYRHFPAIEWVLNFKNGGATDTPILEQILPLDANLPLAEKSAVLHYSKGALCCIDDFAPVEKPLEPEEQVHLQPGGGRSSSEILPFFNIESGSNGFVTGIGWTGEWEATFCREEENALRLQAGMALTHLKLLPGEAIRTPRILMLFWHGTRIRGNNLLRRFILAHHRPQPNGEPLTLPVILSSWGGTSAAEHLTNLQRVVKHELPITCYWIDAEWFGKGSWWNMPGNWEVKSDLYPQGFRPISDMLHQSGSQFLLWFEPHRVCKDTPWSSFKARPNWLLELGNGEDNYKQWKTNGWPIPHDDPKWIIYESRRSQMNADELMFNMGNPNAQAFLTDFISDRIVEFGLDWYREDANIAPLEYWRHADAPDRQGITEIRYIEGLYAFWDNLIQRHPHLMIDNCASGGRRIDLESIGRSTALHRTDWAHDSIHAQCHSYGLFQWVPLHMAARGAVLKKGNEYEFRSVMTAGLMTQLWEEADGDKGEDARRLLEQYLGIRKFYYGDYYPLTSYSQDKGVWMAWQFNLPEDGEGMVQAFRRGESVYESARLHLYELVPDARYLLEDMDTDTSREMTGRELMEEGLVTRIAEKPHAAIITYKRVE